MYYYALTEMVAGAVVAPDPLDGGERESETY